MKLFNYPQPQTIDINWNILDQTIKTSYGFIAHIITVKRNYNYQDNYLIWLVKFSYTIVFNIVSLPHDKLL